MSLLTKEQGRKVLEAKTQIKLYRAMFLPDTSIRLRSLLNEVLTIIDDLQARAQRETAEPDKDLPQELHGWRFDEPLEIFCNGRDRISVENFTAYILERCRRALLSS